MDERGWELMSKERLEEIKTKSKYRDRGYFGGYMSFKDTNWLIEQAERDLPYAYKELLDKNEIIIDLESENKRLKSTLKFYANPGMYRKHASVIDGVTSDIDFDKGERARKLLEELKFLIQKEQPKS